MRSVSSVDQLIQDLQSYAKDPSQFCKKTLARQVARALTTHSGHMSVEAMGYYKKHSEFGIHYAQIPRSHGHPKGAMCWGFIKTPAGQIDFHCDER